MMAACTLSNPVDKIHYEERDARCLHIIKKYNKDEQSKFSELFAHTVMALELNPEQDFLGKIRIRLGLQNDDREQIFARYNICELMPDITMENMAEQIRKSGFIILNDCCCGAALITGVYSARKSLQKIDLDFQSHILVSAQDIDETAALMCYIQLSLLGVAARIKVGNAITSPMNATDTMENYWFTPMYFSNVWAMRRLVHRMDEIVQNATPEVKKRPFRLRVKLDESDCRCSLSVFYERVAKKAGFTLTNNSRFNCNKIQCTKAVQIAVFDFYNEAGNRDELEMIMLWVNSGPKADLNGDDYAVEIEDGFVTKVKHDAD